MKYVLICKKDKQLQKVIFSTPYLDNCDIDRFIISIFDDYEDKKFFDEIFNYIYSNRERYKDYNFYQTMPFFLLIKLY